MTIKATPTNQGTRKQKFLLSTISKDDRLSPNKRLLAALLLGYIEGLYPYTLIECTYGMNAQGRVRWSDKEDGSEDRPTEQDQATKNATEQLKGLYETIRGGQVADSTDSKDGDGELL